MRDIRESFQCDLDRGLNLALSLTTIELFGETQLQGLVSNDPEHPISIGVGTPNPDRKKWKANDLLKEFQNNKGIIQEIVYGYLLQIWYEFLRKIFEKILENHFYGEIKYPAAPKIKIELNFAEDDHSNFLNNIQKKASKSFDFIDNYEKISQIEKSLGRQIDPGLKKRIKQHIVVRNVIQHHRGVLREEDLQKLGIQGGNITLLNDIKEKKTYKEVDRVMISYWEVEAVKNDLHEAANQLIPCND